MKKTNILLKAALLIAAIILFSSSAQESRAATFTVNTPSDLQDLTPGNGFCATRFGQCTLRAAITEANALPGNHIITLPAGIYQITLTAAGEDNNAGGDFDIRSNITINGARSDTTFIQAAGAKNSATERVLHFISGTSTVNDVTVRYGSRAFDGGGILINSSTTLTLNSVTVSNNGSTFSGGGISVLSDGILTISNSLITNNFSGSINSAIGGGLHSRGNTTLNNTTVSWNVAASEDTFSTGGIAFGGGIAAYAGTLNINNSSISNNQVIGHGTFIRTRGAGLLVFNPAIVTITDSLVTGNDYSGSAPTNSGGGICNCNGSLTLNRTLVSDNRSRNGGGIATYCSDYPGVFNFTYINQSSIVNNSGGSGGGGIASTGDSDYIEINNSTIAGNVGSVAGGLSSSNSTINVNFSTIARNIAASQSSTGFAPAGGIRGRANLKNSIIADNEGGVSGINTDISGTFTSQGYNHIENVGTPFTLTTGDVIGTDPMLGELITDGSASFFVPKANSPVIDAIPNGTNGCGTAPFDVDQRGVTRPTDSNTDSVAACEKGAIEVQDEISNCSGIILNPSSLPSGTVGSFYSQTISADGGTAPYIFSVDELPPGLALNQSTGEIVGTPILSGTFIFTVSVTDANSCTGSRTYSVTVSIDCPPITLNPSSLSGGSVGSAYNQTISVEGTAESFDYAITSGTLPVGLDLDPMTGLISGSPVASGSFTFTVTATNASGCQGSREYTITVTFNCPTITLSPSSPANGTVNSTYSQFISASGGIGTYSFTVTGGSLPAGLSLNPNTGEISGNPAISGTFSFTVTAADSKGCTGSRDYSITIASVPVIFNAPSDLRVDYIGGNFVNLRWTDNSNSEAGFVIQMCQNKNCSNSVQVGQTGANATTFLVTQLLANSQYVFRVAAVGSNGQLSAFSNSIKVKTLRE